MFWFNDSEWAIWLTPLDVKPQCERDRLDKPLEIFAIGPAKCPAPRNTEK